MTDLDWSWEELGDILHRSLRILTIILAVLIVSSGLFQTFANSILGDVESYEVKIEGSISRILISGDGSFVAAGSDGGEFGVIALINSRGEILWSWRLRGGVSDIEGTDSLSRIGVVTRARELYVYNVKGYVEFSWERGGKGEFLDLALDSNGKLASVIDSSTPPHLYVISITEPIGRWEEFLNSTPTSACYLLRSEGYDSKLLAVSFDGNFTIYDLEGYDPSKNIEPAFQGVFNVTSSGEVVKIVLLETPKGGVAAATIYSNNFTIIDLEGGDSLLKSGVNGEYITGGYVVDVEASRGGRYVYVGSSDYNVYSLSWDREGYVLKWSISVGREVSDISISRDGSFVVAGTVDGWAYLISSSGDIVWSYKFSSAPVTAVGISGDGGLVAVGCGDGTVYLVRNDGVKRYLLEVGLEDPVGNVTLTITSIEGGETVLSTSITTPSRPMFLLKPGNYMLKIDSIGYGVYSKNITLYANTIASTPPPRFWKVPTYLLTVKVVDGETGEPVGGLTLEFTHTMLSSDKYLSQTFNVTIPPTGTIEIPLLRDVYKVRTVFDEEKLGYENLDVGAVDLTSPPKEPLMLRLKPLRARLEVQVLDDFGEPLSGVKVEVSGVGVDITNSSGRVVFEGLRYGTYTILALHPYFELEKPVKVDVKGDTLVKLGLNPKLFNLELEILDSETLKLLGRANVSIIGVRLPAMLNYTYSPEAKVLTLPYGEYSLQVVARGYSPKTTTIMLDGDKRLEVRLKPVKYRFNLTLLGRYDQPLKSCEVYLESLDYGVLRGVTDDYGVLSLEVRPSTYTLKVEVPHYEEYVESINVSGPLDVTLKLKPENYTIKFEVYDGETNATIPIFEVSIYEFGVKVCSQILTSENNTITLPYGNYTLKVIARHYVESSKNVEVSGDLELEFQLARTLYPLTVIVSDDTGAPMPNVKVVVENPPKGLRLELTTDSTGKSIVTLPFGAYQVSVEASGWNPTSQIVMVEGPLTLEVTLNPTFPTLMLRYIPYVGLAIVAIALLLLVRARRRRGVVEEEAEEI